jgi:hypothetical protein
MPAIPSIFPLWHIGLTALIALVVSLALLRWQAPHFGSADTRETFAVAFVVGLSVLAWRLAGNVPELNDDPVPLFSPNDLLSPVFTYVVLGIYAALRPPVDRMRWEWLRAWLTAVSFIVNVVVI